jgi:hypothetical protein
VNLRSVGLHSQVVRSIRAKVLAGCSIVFSRVFPTGLQNPEFHPLWQLAVELGARCKTACDRSTTHVVALDRGTDKARWAKQHGVYLVHPRWVEAASYQWWRPPEGEFPVTDDASAQILITFSRNVLVEPVVIEVEPSIIEVETIIDEGEPLISIESSSAEVVEVVDLDPDKTEAGPSIDMESDASPTENPNQDSGENSPDSAAEGSLLASGSSDVK